MDLNRVAVFVKVIEEGGISAAARALGLPKSSVSRSVALLEDEIGVRLLRRSTRAVTLTEAGRAFVERAAAGLAAVAEAREAVLDLDSEVRGRVRITTSVDAGVWTLSPLVAEFVAQHPSVLVEVVLTARVVDLVEEGFDLALRAGPMRDDALVARKLPSLDFGLYASPGYLAQHGAPKRVAALAEHRCVLFRAPQGRATWTLTGPRGEERVDVVGAVSADDFSFVMQLVASDVGVALLPSFVAERGGGGRIERILPRHGAPGAPLHLVHPAGRYLPRRVAIFRDFLVRRLTESLGG